MNIVGSLLLIICFGFGLHAQKVPDNQLTLGHGYEFDGNGKDRSSQIQNELYLPWPDLENLVQAVEMSGDIAYKALKIQQKYLESKNRQHHFDSQHFDDDDLLASIEILQDLMGTHSQNGNVKLYRVEGEDGKGNVHFTAYYTPVLEARKHRDSIFQFPIYSQPARWEGSIPTRQMIDSNGYLVGKELELGWTADLLENYFMQVQGSGYLRFADGSLTLLVYGGQNGYAYKSLGNYLVEKGYIRAEDISLHSIRNWFNINPDSLSSVLNLNDSYTFFKNSGDEPKGASNTELIAEHSIAVDPSFIPYGSVLLGKVPILNDQGKLIRHDYRLLTAQDSGGAINGPGHVDLYRGFGNEAEKKAGALHHYGALWLILPATK